jgi:hypothetical protein
LLFLSAIAICKFIFVVINNSDNQFTGGAHYKSYSILFPVTNTYNFNKIILLMRLFLSGQHCGNFTFNFNFFELNIFIFTCASEILFYKGNLLYKNFLRYFLNIYNSNNYLNFILFEASYANIFFIISRITDGVDWFLYTISFVFTSFKNF